MASNKLSALSAVSGSLTSDSLVYIADTQDSGSSYASKKITVANLLSDVASTSDLGTFSGSTIDNNQSIKAALQALETALEAETSNRATAISDLVDGAPALLDTLNELAAAINDDENFVTTITNLIDANETHIDNVATLTGVAKDSANLGTFTGSTVSDSSTVKAALQLLETAVETKATSAVVTEIDGNVDDLISLSGVAEQQTGLGTFTGSTISDGANIKDALQDLETATESAAAGSAVADRTKTVTGSANTNHYLTFVADDNTTSTAETVFTDAGIKYNPSTNLLDIANGTVHAQYLTLANVNLNATATELNVLDGITSTTAELNILDGVTSTAAELNILDGVTSTAAELNILDGVTATAVELNYVDGVTSDIQTQINGKVATGANVNNLVGTTSAQTVPVDGNGDDNYLFLVVNKASGALTAVDKTFLEAEGQLDSGSGVSFAYTPGYAFNGSNVDSTHETYSSGDDVYDDYGIDQIDINNSFLTIHFKDSTSFNTWRSSDHTVTFDYTGTGGAQSWEVTDVDLTTNEEYSVNTTYSYIHYSLSDLVGTQTKANEQADDLSTNGTGSSVLNIEFDA